jgi:malate dehydrogenase (oxaloacetate-decarboxylating)(NADP+)
MVARVAPRPSIPGPVDPTHETLPEGAKRVRDRAILATGRADCPNPASNALCVPFIFRGALGAGSTLITNCGEMRVRPSARTSTRPTSLAGC